MNRVTPLDAMDCARVLAEASRERRPVRIAGGSTKAYLGDRAEADVEIATAGLRGIVDHVPADLTVTVAAGTRIADLAAALEGAGQLLPLDPPHAEAATIGGVIAANSNGFWRARFGGVRDLLIGTRTALPDGTVARAGGRVVKNVAGYDLDKLLVGSLGTLGVIVEATFKVLPQPSARGGMAARFADGSPALAAANAISRSAARPEACVVARRASGPWRLLVTASGANATVDRTMGDARREIASQRGSVEELDGGLDDARELPARATTGALVKVALPLAATAAFAVAAVRFDSFAEVVADVASGVIRIHLLGDEETVVADAGALLLGSGVVGGTGRVERREDHLRDRLPTWPSRPRGDALMRRIKEAFDPNAILERGRAAFA